MRMRRSKTTRRGGRQPGQVVRGAGVALTLGAAIALAGCETPRQAGGSGADAGAGATSAAARLAPIVDPPGPPAAAPLPTYATGDRYVFDNPRESWTVQGVSADRVTWTSDLGGRRVTPRDPLVPSLETTADEIGTIRRTMKDQQGSLWPLSVGNDTSFVVTVEMEGRPPQALAWNCRVIGTDRVEVQAGTFNTYTVACARSDGLRLTTAYAPTLGYFVRRTVTTGDETQTRSLLLADGQAARVARSEETPPPDAAPAGRAEATPLPPPEGAAPSADEARTPTPVVASAPAPAPAPARVAPASAAPPTGSPSAAGWTGIGVRLASFGSADGARKGWAQFRSRYPAILGALGPRVEAVALEGKGTFHRLYAGPFPSPSEARAVCGRIPEMGSVCDVRTLD